MHAGSRALGLKDSGRVPAERDAACPTQMSCCHTHSTFVFIRGKQRRRGWFPRTRRMTREVDGRWTEPPSKRTKVPDLRARALARASVVGGARCRARQTPEANGAAPDLNPSGQHE